MKKLFGAALLALPLLAGSACAEGWPFNVQMGGSFYFYGTRAPPARRPARGICTGRWKRTS